MILFAVVIAQEMDAFEVLRLILSLLDSSNITN
jgi:hypothetical protein